MKKIDFLCLRIKPDNREQDIRYKKIFNIDNIKIKEEIDNKTLTPYKKLFLCLVEETGLVKSDLELIDLTNFGYEDEAELLGQLKNRILPKFHQSFKGYEKHLLTPSPFLIVEEYPTVGELMEDTNELFHIDLYYAFKKREGLIHNDERTVYYTLDEIEDMVKKTDNKLKKDLFYVCKYFNDLYIKLKRPRYRIRTCTFDPEKNMLAITQ